MDNIVHIHTQEKNMYAISLLEVFSRIFSARGYDQALESFITSRNPQNAAEIDNLIVEYQRRNVGSLL